MAYQNAKGNGPATGMEKSKPPVRTLPPPPDEISDMRHPTAGYGISGGQNPSSIPPGAKLVSPLGQNLAASQSSEDGESLLDRVARLGVAKSGSDVDLMSPQTRKIDDTMLPASMGMHKPSGSGTVPSATGSSPFADEQKRGADRLAKG
jgi:hypothetical protein